MRYRFCSQDFGTILNWTMLISQSGFCHTSLINTNIKKHNFPSQIRAVRFGKSHKLLKEKKKYD